MTTELEEQFFKTFGIEKRCLHPKDCAHKGICRGVVACEHYNYPEITDRVLLQLLFIYNDMQSWPETCIIPCNYEDTKEMILNTLINEKLSMKDCEKGTYMDVMTKQIQQLFKVEE